MPTPNDSNETKMPEGMEVSDFIENPKHDEQVEYVKDVRKLHSERGPEYTEAGQDELDGFVADQEAQPDDNWDSSPGRLLEFAMGIISNAGEGDWKRESEEWQTAARRWLDLYHDFIYDGPPTETPADQDTQVTAPTFNERLFAGLIASKISEHHAGLQLAWRQGSDGRAGNIIDCWFPGAEHGLRIQVTEGSFGEPAQKQGVVVAMKETEDGVRAYKIGLPDGNAVTAYQAAEAIPLLPQEPCLVTATPSGFQVSPLPGA